MYSHFLHSIDSVGVQTVKDVGVDGVKKTISTIKKYFKSGKFLDSLYQSGVTPNGLVTFRIVLMTSGAVTYLLEKNIGAIMMTTSCILDATDGKLARNYNMKSKAGEIYDPISDKISEIFLSLSSLVNLNPSQFTTQASLLLPKLWLHYKSQFNEKRGGVKEQFKVIRELIVDGDKNTQYIEGITLGAANSAGKWKTALQFTSGLGLIWLHTGLAQEIIATLLKSGISISIEEVNDFLTWLFIGTGFASIPLSLQSIYGRKDKKIVEKLSDEEIQTKNDAEIEENPYFLAALGVSAVGVFYAVWEFAAKIKSLTE